MWIYLVNNNNNVKEVVLLNPTIFAALKNFKIH